MTEPHTPKCGARCVWNAFGYFLFAGFRPCRRPPFVSAKGGKTISARLRPHGGPSATAPNKMARELAPLKQLSPKSRFGAPAPPHPKAGIPTEGKTSKPKFGFFLCVRSLLTNSHNQSKNSLFPHPLLRWARLGLRPESYFSGEGCLSGASS